MSRKRKSMTDSSSPIWEFSQWRWRQLLSTRTLPSEKRGHSPFMTVSDSMVTGEKTTAEERETSFADMIRVALEVI